MAQDNGAAVSEGGQHLVGGGRPGLDGIKTSRQWVGIAESDGIHGYGAIFFAEQRQHLAKFVPGTWRLMQ